MGGKDVEKNHLLKPQTDVTARLCVSYRLLVTLLSMAAMLLCFANQSSMGSTMVCMTVDSAGNNSTQDPSTTTVPSTSPGFDTQLEPYKFDWDKETQGWIHSSLFIGYYVTQLPSGILATRYGGRRVAIFGLVVSAVAQLVTPIAAESGVTWLCFVRAVCGFASGFVYAPVFGVLANWVPAAESSLLFGLAGTGIELGAVLSFSLSALMCETGVMGGWPLTYYIIGSMGIVIALVFYFLVSDLPSQNRWVSSNERRYIETLVGQAGGHGRKDNNDNSALTTKIPVRRILTSPPVWAIVVSQIGSDWLYYLFITVMPSFMKEIIQLPDTTITLLTGLPMLGIIPTIYISGSFADFLRKRKILSTTAVRKVSDFICKILPGAIMVSMGFLGPGQETLFIVLYVLSCILLAFIYLSWITNPVDLSPTYTGFIASVCETGAMWIAIVVPIMVESLTKDKIASQWRLVFYISGGLQVFTFLFYVIFGSSVLQPWGRPEVEPALKVKHNTAAGSVTAETLFNAGDEEHSHSHRRPSSVNYLSDGEIGRPRLYRTMSPFLSDAEDDHYLSRRPRSLPPRPEGQNGNRSRRFVSYTKASTSPKPDQDVTSDSEHDYVTMDGTAPAVDEDLYESINYDASNQLQLNASHRKDDEPVYENVIRTDQSTLNRNTKQERHTQTSDSEYPGSVRNPESKKNDAYGTFGRP